MATTQKNGGAARAAALTATERSAIAKKGGAARWAKQATLFDVEKRETPPTSGGIRYLSTSVKNNGGSFDVLGTPGLRRLGMRIFEGSLSELTGREGMKRLKEMADLDPIIGASLVIFKLLLRDADFKVHAASEDDAPGVAPEDLQARADFIDGALKDMDGTFDDAVTEACSMFWAGWSFLEVVLKYRRGPQPDPVIDKDGRTVTKSAPSSKYNDGLIGWRLMSLRGQQTLWEWIWDEETGTACGWRQMDMYSQRGTVTLPLSKGIHFRTDPTKSNPEGFSMLTHAYTTYKVVKRLREVEAIGIARNLNGVPVIRVPPNVISPAATGEDLAMREFANKIAFGLCVDDGAAVLLSSGHDPQSKVYDWDVSLLTTGSGNTGASELAQKSIARQEQRMATTVLTAFLLLGQDQVGTQALAQNNTDMLLQAINAVVSSVCDAFNRQAIPRLIVANGWDPSESPVLRAEKIKRVPSLTEVSAYISALTGAGIAIAGDAGLEESLLDRVGLKREKEDEL